MYDKQIKSSMTIKDYLLSRSKSIICFFQPFVESRLMKSERLPVAPTNESRYNALQLSQSFGVGSLNDETRSVDQQRMSLIFNESFKEKKSTFKSKRGETRDEKQLG